MLIKEAGMTIQEIPKLQKHAYQKIMLTVLRLFIVIKVNLFEGNDIFPHLLAIEHLFKTKERSLDLRPPE